MTLGIRVPFCDLRRVYLASKDEFDAAYQSVMQRGVFILGPELEAFEHEFAAFCGASYALGVGNGLDALALILRAMGIGSGDEVIVSAHTFIASWLAISYCGATPVPVGTAKGGFLIDIDAIEKRITPRTKAIMPVHLYGEAVDMTTLLALAGRHNLPVVEDAAQAHGARHRGRACGSFGAAAGFSFYPAKNLGAFGDGGAITTSDARLFATLKRLRNYGADIKYAHDDKGFNSRLDELQAAFLRVRLRRLEAENKKRRATAALYNEAFKGLDFLRVPAAGQAKGHVWHQYVVETPCRDALRAHLDGQGVDTLIHYPIANHKQKAYAAEDFQGNDLADYEKLVSRILSLPIDATMTESEKHKLIDAVRCFKP